MQDEFANDDYKTKNRNQSYSQKKSKSIDKYSVSVHTKPS